MHTDLIPYLALVAFVAGLARAPAPVSGFWVCRPVPPGLGRRVRAKAGGVAGTGGGFRRGALRGCGVPRHTFVATATAVGLVVDGARLPVYLATQGEEIAGQWPFLVTATASAILGTLVGARILSRLP